MWQAAQGRPATGRLWRGRGVAGLAGSVISCEFPLERRVGRMTGQTAQPAFALAETGAGGQRGRLVAHVPGVTKIDSLRVAQGHAMAGSAEIVEPIGGEASGIVWAKLREGSGVCGGGPVAYLAPHSQLMGRDCVIGSQAQRTGGVARKSSAGYRRRDRKGGSACLRRSLLLAWARRRSACDTSFCASSR